MLKLVLFAVATSAALACSTSGDRAGAGGAASGGTNMTGGDNLGGIMDAGGSVAATGGIVATGGEISPSGGSGGEADAGGTGLTGGAPATGGAKAAGDAGSSSTCSLSMATTNATITVDKSVAIRTIPDDLYGWNTTIWSGGEQNGSNASYNALLANAGFKVMRWPGGSWGDSHAWNNTQCDGTWIISYAQSKALYQRTGIKMQPIVNFAGYWCGAQHIAAEANKLAADWVTEGGVGGTYWEVGNEIMGGWEQGHTIGSDYGSRFADFYKAMRAASADIKILAVGDQNDKNDSFNPGTGIWTREVLKAAKAKGVVPDGFQIHNYPGTGGNIQLLHADLDAIGGWTTTLNKMVSDETGKGQLAYCMTEFGAAGNDRWLKMIGAQLALQYIMEMAKNNWATANIFGELYSTTTYVAAPAWYVYAFLYGKFGRDMVTASSDNTDVRGYASMNGNDLTIWVANNATVARTVKVKVAGFAPACTGTIWTMEGANGGGEEATDIAINGTVHPSEAGAKTMAGKDIAASASFDVSLPKSSIALLKLSPG